MRDSVLSNLIGTLEAFFKIEGGLEGKEISTPATPATGYQKIYPKSGGDWYKLDDGGSESLLGGAGGVAVPIGTVILSYTGAITGAATLSEIRAAGFATCDGTTASSQGISGATITSAMPDLNADQDFLMGHDTTAGSTGGQQIESHTHSVYTLTDARVDYVATPGGWSYKSTGLTSGAVHDANAGAETRPINISVVCCMRVK